MGFLPEAMRNYLARLGWSHGNDEFFTTEQAIAWFDLGHLGKAPARFDLSKLAHLSGQHIRAADGRRPARRSSKPFSQRSICPPLTAAQRADAAARHARD